MNPPSLQGQREPRSASRQSVRTKFGVIAGMWEMDENERRDAIARRASRGASKTLGRRDMIRIAPTVRVPLAPDAPIVPQSSSWRRIIFETAIKHSVPPKDITGPFRDRNIVAARHEVFWRIRNELNFSLPRIGQMVGGRDHSTVLSGIRAHERRMANVQREGLEPPLSPEFTTMDASPLTLAAVGRDEGYPQRVKS